MKAILKKDFLYFRRQGRLLPVVVAVFAVLIVMQVTSSGGPSTENIFGMVSAFSTVFAFTLTMNIVGMDEQAKWDGFVRSLPIKVSSIVGAQYVLTAILSAVGVAVELIFGLAVGSGAKGLAIACAFTAGVPLLLCSFLLPVYYKFGYQKSAVLTLLIIFLIIGISSLLQKRGIVLFSEASISFWLRLSPVLLVAAVSLSFLLSCHIYAGKER